MSQSQAHPADPLPPSAKAAWLAIRFAGPLNPTEIIEETRLSERSVTRALKKLTDAGLVTRQPPTNGDARRTVYVAAGDPEDDSA